MMRFLRKNNFAMAIRCMTIAFLFASTGFTTVVQRCSMQGAKCCGDGTSEMACARDVSSPIPGAVMFDTSNRCFSSSLAGGFLNATAILVKPTVEWQKCKVASLDADVSLLPESLSKGEAIPARIQNLAVDSSPLRIPKYLLHASLLI